MDQSIKELTDLLLEFVRMVNTFWGAYATVSVALLGWLFGSKRKWLWQQRFAVAIAYCSVAVVNCLAQMRFNALIAAALSDLRDLLPLNDKFPALSKTVGQIPVLHPYALAAVYVLVTVGVVYLTWNQPRFHATKGDVES